MITSTANEFMQLRFVVMWSIYVQCKHKRKLVTVHLPAIDDAIGKTDAGWVIEREGGADLFRVVSQRDFYALTKDEAALAMIRKAYALFDGTRSFSGLSTLNINGPLYIMAGVDIQTPRHLPPAITNVMLEVEQR